VRVAPKKCIRMAQTESEQCAKSKVSLVAGERRTVNRGIVNRSRFNHFPRSALRYNSAVSDKNDFLELPGLRVTVDRVIHHRDAQTPPDRPHCFAYFITIHNDSDVAVTIKGRKWVVKNARGEITAVEGDGVVGQFPKIVPGESFSYNSFHLNDTTTAVAEGSYIGIDERGRKVLTRIPKFKMDARGTSTAD
jgi:ApaG protein